MSSPQVDQTPIQRLGLSPRSHNSLVRAQLTTVGAVLEKSDDELLKIRNFVPKPLEELYRKLAEQGISRFKKDTRQPGEEEQF